MQTKTQNFTYHAHEEFRVRVHRNFSYPSNEMPDIRVIVDGIMHPMAADSNYGGEETKNPQMARATQIVSDVFDEVARVIPESLRPYVEVTALKNNGMQAKTAYIGSRRGIPEAQKEELYRLGDLLESMIRSKSIEIETALEAGRNIPLTDPNPSIDAAFVRALGEAGRHSGLDGRAYAVRAIEIINPEPGNN